MNKSGLRATRAPPLQEPADCDDVLDGLQRAVGDVLEFADPIPHRVDVTVQAPCRLRVAPVSFEQHLDSKSCLSEYNRRKEKGSLLRFMKPKAPKVSATVSAPLPLIGQSAQNAPVQAASKNAQPERPKVLTDLLAAITRLPLDIPEANDGDVLADFAIDFPAVVDLSQPPEWLWENGLNGIMHRAFWGKSLQDTVAMVRRGPLGVDAFYD